MKISRWSRLNIYVIGCGGIGGYLINMLPKCLASLIVDYDISSGRATNQEVMGSDGTYQLSQCFEKIVLIDGDHFDGHNALRQAGAAGSKLAVQMQNIRKDDAFTVWLNTVQLIGYQQYITPRNIRNIIDTNSVVFMCVDNHKTRYEVTKYCETLDNVLLINGGNSKTSGNVTIYERVDGEAMDPPIYKIYPEVSPDADKRPDETSCTAVAPENDQVAIVNNMIASIMLARFSLWCRKGNFDEKTPKKNSRGCNIYERKNEVVVDMTACTMKTLHREI